MLRNALTMLSLLLILSVSGMGNSDSNHSMLDYQKQVKTLEHNNSVAAVEELYNMYGDMATIARKQGDTITATQYEAKQMHMNDILIQAREAAQRMSQYQESTGLNESDLKIRLNLSAARADANPLNASTWKELSSVADDIAIYHTYDQVGQDALGLKDDADRAGKVASTIQQYGINSVEANEALDDVSSDGGNCLATVVQAAKTAKKQEEKNNLAAQYRNAYQTAISSVAYDSNRTTGPDSYKAWAALAIDYVMLSNAMNSWDDFNNSNNISTVRNNIAYPGSRLDAIRCFDRAIKTAESRRGPVSLYWLNEGRVYNALGDRANATRCFDQGITSAAKEHNNETLIGCLYLKAKDENETELDQAAKCYEYILTMDSYDPRIWKVLSQVYKKLGRYSDASIASDNADLFQYESRSVLPGLPSADL